jgi:glucose/arabinose dehydrogenase/PKD repeat protein
MKLRGALPVFLAVALAHPASAILPQGFSDVLVANLTNPTALAFTPDGRLLIAQQAGIVRVYQEGRDGALVPAAALTIPAAQICNNFENGLLGITVDPAFQENGFVYLYYTAKRPDAVCVNRVSRFVMSGDTLDPASQAVLIDNIPSPNGNHNGGDLKFGKDGYLYVSVGDGGCDWLGGGCQARNDASRDEFVLLGKILRITSDGGIPPGNPFQGQGTVRCNVTGRTDPGFRCQETFAWGFRNPFRIAHDPNADGVRLFINDVGQNTREEIDLAQAGGDYGWNCKEGTRTNSTAPSCQPLPQGLVPPIYEYDHNALVPGTSVSNCGSVTGGAFVPNGLWPTYDGAYLFGDYVCGALFVLKQSGGAWFASDFASGLGADSAVTMIFGPHGHTQALYYTSYSGGGVVRKIFYDVEGNEPPTAVASADPVAGTAPLTVTFDASGSSDPDGDVMTYIWSFGDGSDEEITQLTHVQHTYQANGIYNATLRARDSEFEVSAPVTVQIQAGNTPPEPTILSPDAADRFRVGQTVTLTGGATDAEDGALPDSALSWVVVLHHNGDHTHPVLGPQTGSGLTFTAPAPEGLDATERSYLEIRLTATDSTGLSRTVTQNFLPNRLQLTFDTSPAGLLLVVNGEVVTAPRNVVSWEGYGIEVDAPDQIKDDTAWHFVSWSDGGASTHILETPASATTYTATFQPPPPDTGVDFHTLAPCRVIDTRNSGQGPALRFKTQRTFTVAGNCGIPSTAKAITVNVTAFNPLASGHLRIAPSGAAASNTSVINFRSGVTIANNAILSLSDTGTISVYCFMSSGATHFLLDVVGYYE